MAWRAFSIFSGLSGWTGRHGKIFLALFGVIMALAAFARFWAAPLSTGPDVAQFWAFAKMFHIHGLDFYRYADASLDIFPYKGWGYFYPPVWLLLLGLALLFVPASVVNEAFIDTGWRVAAKTPIILSDLAIGALLFWAVPGSRARKLAFASLWLLHPTAWYESAVFGQFDAIAAALLLASVILMMRGKDIPAFLLAGLAVATKQHTLISVAIMVAIAARHMDLRRLITGGAIIAGVLLAVSVPFLVTGQLLPYIRSVVLPASAPGYQNPLVFASSGSGALLTYLHDVLGWETGRYLPLTIPLLVTGLVLLAVFGYRGRLTPLQGALAGFLLFTSLFYRVNYQYLVIYIPLAVLLAAQTRYRGERIMALGVAALPAVWLWLTNLPWWFVDHDPVFGWVVPWLERAGFSQRYLSDYAYVSLAAVMMLLSLAYVGLALTRWRGEAVTQTVRQKGKAAEKIARLRPYHVPQGWPTRSRP